MVSAEADAANPAITTQANFLSMISLTSLFQTAHVECHSDGAFSRCSIAAGPNAGLLIVPPTVPTAAAPQPKIDSQHEAGLAAQGALVDAEQLITVMVFCKIGKIEANGKLFEHMRDPSAP